MKLEGRPQGAGASRALRKVALMGRNITSRKEALRRLGWGQAAAAALKPTGIRIYHPAYTWPHDPEYLAVWAGFPESSEQADDRHFNLYNIAKLARLVPGDTAECGAFRGAGSHLILSALEGCAKHHHIFDSFEGLSSPQSVDSHPGKEGYWEAGDLAAEMSIVQANLAQFDHVSLHRGWIPERFPEVEDRTFALVHIDVDLYQPTHDSMAFFYERMNPGGVIIDDDYGSDWCPGARRAIDEFMSDKPEPVVHLTTGQALIVKR